MTSSERSTRLALPFMLLFGTAADGASPTRDQPVAATIDTTLPTRGEQIRQLAFDGDEASSFASQQPPGADDHFTLVLDEPVRLRAIAAITGRVDGGDAVRAGTLEVSADGKSFHELARFAGGTARGGSARETVRAIRIKPGPADGPIAIRQLTIDSDPPVATFRYYPGSEGGQIPARRASERPVRRTLAGASGWYRIRADLRCRSNIPSSSSSIPPRRPTSSRGPSPWRGPASAPTP